MRARKLCSILYLYPALMCSLSAPVYADPELDPDPESEFIKELQHALSPAERAEFCDSSSIEKDNPSILKKTELKNFVPSYFFRNANLSGSEILAAGYYRKDPSFSDPGIYHLNLENGKVTRLNKDETFADPVPLLGLHDKSLVISAPESRGNPGLKFFKILGRKNEALQRDNLIHSANIPGSYQSFGRIAGNSGSTTYRVLTDRNFFVKDDQVPTGLTIGEVTVSGHGKEMKLSVGKLMPVCQEYILQLPMLSPDGKNVIALQYDAKTNTAETRVFNIEDGKCRPLPIKFGFFGGKGSISFDGKKVALSVPRELIKVSPSLRALKDTRPSAENPMDVLVIDLETGKRVLLTGGPMSSLMFPTFNNDGTINVYERQFREGESKTFITRMDPKKAPSLQSNSQLLPQNCNSPSDEEAAKVRKVLGTIHELSCTTSDDGYRHLRFDTMSKKECQNFFRALLNNPKVVTAAKRAQVSDSSALYRRYSFGELSLKEMYELCPER